MAKMLIPPGGFLGWGNQTPAVQQLLNRPGSRRTTTRRKTTRKKTRRKVARRKSPVRRRRTTARKAKPARMIKGSAAAKRHMAKLRRMRRKG